MNQQQQNKNNNTEQVLYIYSNRIDFLPTFILENQLSRTTEPILKSYSFQRQKNDALDMHFNEQKGISKIMVNTFKPKGISHYYQLDRPCWVVFFFFNSNSKITFC